MRLWRLGSEGRMAGLQHDYFIPTYMYTASVVINSITSQPATEESVTHAIYFFDFSGNNARIIGSHSGITGQFCENRGIEL